jgi:hypothetical protein
MPNDFSSQTLSEFASARRILGAFGLKLGMVVSSLVSLVECAILAVEGRTTAFTVRLTRLGSLTNVEVSSSPVLLLLPLLPPSALPERRLISRDSEETCKGVKNVRVLVDSVLHFNSVVRKAPGASNFDYAQFLPLISAAAGGGTSSHSFRKALNLGASLDFGLLPTFGEGAADSNVSGSSSGRSSSVKDVGRSGNSSGLSTGPMGVDLRSLSYSPEPLTETTPRDSAGFFSSNPSNAANSAVKDARAVTWGRSTASGLDVGGVDTDSGDRWNVNRIERPSGPVIMQQRWESSDDVRKGADKVTEQRNTAPYDEDDDDIFAQSIGGISVSLLGVPVVQQYETPVSTEFVFVVYCSAGDRDLL